MMKGVKRIWVKKIHKGEYWVMEGSQEIQALWTKRDAEYRADSLRINRGKKPKKSRR